MNLPKFLTRWVDKHIDAAWEDHLEACAYTDIDPHDIDMREDWRNNLHYWFPDFPDGRTIEWGEIWATVWSPSRKRLRLCKIGWHSYTRGIITTGTYYCADCPATTQKVPRWAR